MTELRKIDALPQHAAEVIEPLMAGEWPILKRNIDAGIAEVFEVNGDSYAVTRIESEMNELVIVAYVGRGALEFARAMYRIAKQNDIATIRFHADRAGLGRMARQFGKVEVENVYRVTIQ